MKYFPSQFYFLRRRRWSMNPSWAPLLFNPPMCDPSTLPFSGSPLEQQDKHLSSCWQDTQSNISTPSGLTFMVVHILHLRGHVMFPKTSILPRSKAIKTKINQELSSKTCSFLAPFLRKQGGAAVPAKLLLNPQLILVLHITIQQQVICFLH